MGQGIGRVIRDPRLPARLRRSIESLTNTNNLQATGGAVQFVDGKITFVIAAGEPFTQSASGFAITIDADDLEIVSSTLGLNPDVLRGVERRRTHHRFDEGAVLGQVQSEEAAEEAIVTASAISWMGL